MERGVFSIAGFLGLAEELRILWSAPYLSRPLGEFMIKGLLWDIEFSLGFRVYE